MLYMVNIYIFLVVMLAVSNKNEVIIMTLDKIDIGQSCKIVKVGGYGALRRRLLDMGLTPKTQVMIRKVAPMGDPIELCLRGYELTIRKDDAKNIEVVQSEEELI